MGVGLREREREDGGARTQVCWFKGGLERALLRLRREMPAGTRKSRAAPSGQIGPCPRAHARDVP